MPDETGTAIQETYLHYLRCERDRFDQVFPPGSAPPSGTPVPPVGIGPSAEMLTYFSDRLRYDRLSSELPTEQQAALDAYRYEPRATTVLETFPLPVTQPQDYAIWSLLPYIDEIDELASVFGPSDVYLLPDGRYGAVQGTVTTAALDDPNTVTADDHLLFIAFVEDDGRYFIDEIFTIFGPRLQDFEAQGWNGTLVTDCD